MKKAFLCLFAMMLAVGVKAQNFTIDLTLAEPTLPAGVTLASYSDHGAQYHGNQHGWCWYAFTFHADGPVKITLGGCQYINDGYEAYVMAGTTKLADIATKTAACYHQDNEVNVASYTYKGEAADLTVYCGQYCPFVKVEPFDVNAPVEKEIVNTRFKDFADYEACADKGEATNIVDSLVTKKSKETIRFYMHDVNVYAGGSGKVSQACSAPDKYLCAMKQNAGDTATITTSAFASITTLSYFHRATGNDRGWGLQAKGDGDTDWVTLYDTKTNSSGTNTGDIAVNRTNVQLRWYNLSIGNYAALTNLVINGMVTEIRTFKDFELNFMNISELPAAPAGVISLEGTPRNDSHGLNSDFRMVIPVDGAVKFTFGGCQYSGTPVTIKNAAGATLATVDVATCGCYHNGGTATWTYNSEDADTLTIIGAQYNPYIKAEKAEFVPDVVVTYRDQNKVLLGYDTIAPGQPFDAKYGAADLTIPEGFAFRGWVNAGGVKYTEARNIDEDTELFASVSVIEHATVGSHFVFDFKQSTFYFEDHELVALTDGKYNGKQHGWQCNAGSRLSIVVSPKAYVNIGMCTYSPTGDQIIRNAAGDSVSSMHIINYYAPDSLKPVTQDGTVHSFYYANAAGVQDTIVIDFVATSYIHQVEVYNVANPVEKVGKRYNIPAGDGATLMMVLPILEAGDTVYCPNGTYDFGETALTTISANNCVLMGESMAGTIIKNAPAVENEGIGTTATILNTSTGLVIKDLTIQNALDYYKAGSAGRAVTLWDKGDKTACYRVKLLSYQDTYYSNHSGSQMYFEDCEIHGTVDYICGDASVYFYNTLLYCEKRSLNGSGSDCITANNGIATDKGYVFDRCTIKSEQALISLGRAWNNAPKTAYLLTTMDMSAGDFTVEGSGIQRWTINGMNALPDTYGEYNTMDVNGVVISPASNEVTFNYNGTKTLETILGYEAAVALSYPNFFVDWNPAENYVAFPEPATGLDKAETAAPVRKMIINGQVVVVRDGKMFNLMGVAL